LSVSALSVWVEITTSTWLAGWYSDNSVLLQDPGIIRTRVSEPPRLLETRHLSETRCLYEKFYSIRLLISIYKPQMKNKITLLLFVFSCQERLVSRVTFSYENTVHLLLRET